MTLTHTLCVITDEELSGLRHRDVAARALEGGAAMVQLRDKRGDVRHLHDEGLAIRHLCRQHGGCFIVNDRVDLALAVEADGVHLGQEDLPASMARRLLKPGMLLGVSTHSVEQAREAEEAGADYIGFGPVFVTHTKAGTEPVVGLAGIRNVRAAVRVPVMAIGGITLERVADVLRAGADGIAVISAVAGAGDIPAACRQLLARIRAHREGKGVDRGR